MGTVLFAVVCAVVGILVVMKRETLIEYMMELELGTSRPSPNSDEGDFPAVVRHVSSPPTLPQPDQLQNSTLAGFLKWLAFLSIFVGVIGLLMSMSSNSDDRSNGLALFLPGVGGGVSLLALAKVIECLHEIVFRLRNIERIARRQSHSGQGSA